MHANAGPSLSFSDAVQSSIALYTDWGDIELPSVQDPSLTTPTSTTTTLILFIHSDLSVTAAALISLRSTSTPRNMAAALIACTDPKGRPTRPSAAGTHT